MSIIILSIAVTSALALVLALRRQIRANESLKTYQHLMR